MQYAADLLLSRIPLNANRHESVISRPIAADPGSLFNHNSGATIVLTSILNQAVGDVEAFAVENVFTHLGIDQENYLWNTTTEGLPNGSHGLVMRPRRMTETGCLYLKSGYWGNRQIISRYGPGNPHGRRVK